MQHREIIRYGEVQDIAAANSQGMFHYPSHWHNEAEFALALKNECVYRIGETDYTLSEGDILLIWPREMHEMVSVPEGGTIFIQFSASLLESNRDLSVAFRLISPVHQLTRAEYPELTETLARMMKETIAIYESEDFFRETRCKLIVYQMLLQLAENGSRAKIRQSGQSLFSLDAWTRMRQACAYIDSHYTENLRQTEVADAVGLSPWYFSRLFRQYVQMTFPEYLARVRVHAARRLLIDSGLTITECAYQAGFQSTTVFNRVFAETTGTSPREYRRIFLSAPNGQ